MRNATRQGLVIRSIALSLLLASPVARAWFPFNPIYSSAFRDGTPQGEQRVTCFERAVAEWQTYLNGFTTVNIAVDFGGSGGGFASTDMVELPRIPSTFSLPIHIPSSILYPTALAIQLPEFVPKSDELTRPHMTIRFAAEQNWDYVPDGEIRFTPGGQNLAKFYSIALHELGHGFGFNHGFNSNAEYFAKDSIHAYDCMLGYLVADYAVPWIEMAPAERQGALRQDRLYWIGPNARQYMVAEGMLAKYKPRRVISSEAGLILQMNDPMRYTEGSSISHVNEGFDTFLLMGPGTRNEYTRYTTLDISPTMLADIGAWIVSPLLSPVEVGFPLRSLAGGAKGTDDLQETVTVTNYGSTDITLSRSLLVGVARDSFELAQGEVTEGVTLPPLSSHKIAVDYDPFDQGMKTAYLVVSYSTEEGAGAYGVRLTGGAVGLDSDEDGISDLDETYYGSPFDPVMSDSDGNGQPDGYDDFDDDGVINGEEFLLETDPLNCQDFPDANLVDGVTEYVAVTNPADWDMVITRVRIVGSDADDYFLTSGTEHQRVPPGGEMAIGVAFAPLSEGEHSDAQLVVQYDNGVEEKTHTIDLSGTGVYPQ